MSKQKIIKEISSEINTVRYEINKVIDVLLRKNAAHDIAVSRLIFNSLKLDKENEELRKQIKEK